MNRRVIVALAVVMSVLVVTVPVAASHQLSVESSHTTDTDFDAGDLTNMTVTGSGATASVEFNSTITTIDDFEDGDIAEYGGDTGNFTVQSNIVRDGAFALRGDVETTGHRISDTDDLKHPVPGDEWRYFVRLNDTDDQAIHLFATQSESSTPNTYRLDVAANVDQLRIFKRNASGSTSLNTTSAAISSHLEEWLRVEVSWAADGTITMTVFDNTGTELGTVSATDSEFTSGGVGWQTFNPNRASEVYFDTAEITTDSEVGSYISANHTAGATEQGFVNITENANATATVTWETSDGGPWHTINQTSGITTAANHTFTWPVESNSTVRVNVTVENATGNGIAAFTMADEGVQFTANDTFVDNSSASPTGGVSTATPTLEIDINDADFPLVQGDSVTVEFFVDGSSDGTDTLTANGTASHKISALSGGDHTWHVVATDDYGHSVTSQTFTISTPSNVTFRREQPEHPIIDDRQINVTVYGEDDGDQFVQNFTTTNGNVSLTGVPVDERLVIVAMADGYHQREVVITDVFNQTDMYLLNTSETSVEVTFDIQDTTGEFTKTDTEFLIERSINRTLFDTGGFTAEAIAGDRIGAATEYTADLKQDQRYTIVIRNPGGDTRTLGAQVAKENGTVPIRITSIDLDANETQGFNWTARTINDSGNEFVEFVYVDEEDLTTSVDLVIYEYGNASNEIHNQTHTGTFGTLKVTEQLVGDDANKTWAVQFDATRGSETESGTVVVGQRTQPLGVPLDDEWKYRVALLSLVIVGFIVGGGVTPEAGGIAIVCAAGMWHYVGWMPAEVTGVAIGIGALAAVGFAVGTRGGEPVQ